ncbi:hypothetical protein HOL24_00180 [bacterium]|jgi:hypothetical protein|nr:hypothetical protein [bacterium]
MLRRIWNSPVLMTWGNLLAKSSSLILLLPLILTNFSSVDIVVWYVYSTIISLQMLIDFGFTPTITRIISYAYGGLSIREIEKLTISDIKSETIEKRPNYSSIYICYLTSKYAYLLLVVISLCFSAVIGTWLVSDSLSSSTTPNDAWLGWWLVLIVSAVTLYGNTYVSFLQGLNKVALVQRVQMFMSIMSIISATLTLLMGQSILVVVSAFYAWNLVGVIANKMLTSKYINKSDNNKANFDFFRKIIWSNAWRSGVGVMLSLGLVQFSALIVTKIASPAVAATYMLSLQLVRAASSFSQAPFYAKLPKLAQLYAQSSIDTLVTIAKKGILFSLLTFILITIFIGTFGSYFLEMIGANATFPEKYFWFILSFAFLIERLGASYLQLYSLTGDIIWHIANGVTGILVIIFIFILYNYMNIYAFPLSMLIGYTVFYTPYVIIKSVKVFGQIGTKEIYFLFSIFLLGHSIIIF